LGFSPEPGKEKSLTNEAHILLIDPERDLRTILALRLESEGDRCLQADSLAEAWKILETESVQAIVSEMILPDASGLDLLKGLRERNHDIPVVYLTAYGNVEWAKEAIRHGAYEYYDKPFDLKKLSEVLHKSLRAGVRYGGPERRQFPEVAVDRLDLASRDELTGLASHRFVLEKLPTLHSECSRKNIPLTICLIDIDGFRKLNHRKGVGMGDLILIEAGRRLRRIVRTNDLVARYGSDEFILVLPGATHVAAEKLSDRIKKSFEQENWQLADEQIRLPLCIGIVAIDNDETADNVEFLDRAIEALHHAKLQGPGSVVTWRRQLVREHPLNFELSEQSDQGPDVESINVMMWRFRELNRRLSNVTLESLRLLVAAVEARDPYTKHHSVRVASFARYLASEFDLPESQIRTIHSAALLHDIGKIGIPDAVLTKPGRLTPDEMDLIRQHPAIAVNILEQTRFFIAELPMVKHHHEWFNGQGYPDNIEGQSIPLGSRIIHVADATEAMLARRSYKDPYDLDFTIRQLREGTGRQFDPMLADLAIRLIRSGVLQQLWKGHDAAEAELDMAAAK
jgi:diguanylate cyclase (GGDEF)-like protein/putative nucleotidyltransferase with HDIG domain